MGALRHARLSAPIVCHGSSSMEPLSPKSLSQETVHRGSLTQINAVPFTRS